MPNIPGIPEDLAPVPGIQMVQPPPDIIGPTTKIIEQALANLRDGERGRLVWIAQKVGDEKSVNAAVVSKIGDHVEVTAWIGKSWGTPVSAGLVYGGAGTVHW